MLKNIKITIWLILTVVVILTVIPPIIILQLDQSGAVRKWFELPEKIINK